MNTSEKRMKSSSRAFAVAADVLMLMNDENYKFSLTFSASSLSVKQFLIYFFCKIQFRSGKS